MGHQSYVLLCSKITSFQPSEGQFSEKSGSFSKVKIFQNSFYEKLGGCKDKGNSKSSPVCQRLRPMKVAGTSHAWSG